MDQSCLIKRQSENKIIKKSIKRDASVHSWQYKRPTGTWSSVARKMAYLPVRIANSGNSAADIMFWYSFRILPGRLKLIQLYPCGSLGPDISFIFGAQAGHFAATPQSDIVRICAHDFGVKGTLRYDRKCLFSCIYNHQITISPTSSFSASFNGNRVKNHPKPWTCLYNGKFMTKNNTGNNYGCFQTGDPRAPQRRSPRSFLCALLRIPKNP